MSQSQSEEMPAVPEKTYLNSAYGRHVLGCAEIAAEVAGRLKLHNDSAIQACFATVCIDAKDQQIFFGLTPEQEKDKVAAKKADAQIKEIDPAPTPEKADGVLRSELLEKINSARDLLNKEGHVPPITPGALNALIKSKLQIEGNLGTIDTDDMEKLLKVLSERLDEIRAEKKPSDDDVPF